MITICECLSWCALSACFGYVLSEWVAVERSARVRFQDVDRRAEQRRREER